MTYVTSNLHGRLELWQRLLDLIGFQESDMMFILGDIVDIGPKSVPLLFDLMERPNVYPILGDHDCNMLMCIRKLPMDTTMSNLPKKTGEDVLPILRTWLKNGGRSTIEQYLALDEDQKEQILDYLSEFTLYEDITIPCLEDGKERRFVLTHSGLKNFSPERELEDYHLEEFLTDAPTAESRYFEDASLVFGHQSLGGEEKIFHGPGFTGLCCGEKGPLGCLRLEDGKEFYAR